MLPLYSLAVASMRAAAPSRVTAANIVIAQLVMFAVAACASRASRAIRRWGFWWIILATLATRRAITAAWVTPSWGIVPVQVFDCLGAGLQSVALPALVVHLLHGSGRVSLGKGAVDGVAAAGACVSSDPWRVARAFVRLSGGVHHAREL
ncbi:MULTISPECIES: hypothetical protein [unclassified Caballeronia]|uniref:hypothetical protein n=1 Tax=unclassified Caballeronia TaxID=2646786 RepID=UPI00285B6CCB|nr:MULTISPECIES: hypothetical protein [unclassified Caballeronia]MDR5755171.1 hypothetical protein [Caballeronia sp. LZ024]MDR5845354.1 hypothetical protein [Caballeronia sp. LZ031]